MLPDYLVRAANEYRLQQALRLSAKTRVQLPQPFALQTEIINSPAKRKVVNAGRRFGKTVLAGIMAWQHVEAGKRVLLSSTSQDQSDVFWENLTRWTGVLVGSSGYYKNESKRILKLHDGYLRVKTGSNPDVLRGGNYDLLVLDECAYLDPDAWNKVAAPMLADTGGTAVFISTPARRNWFFQLYQRAIADDSGYWKAWHATTLENPHLNAEAVGALAKDMTEEDYRQEILALFLEGQGTVFRYVEERSTASKREPYSGTFVAGVDFAVQNDFTVITVIDVNTRTVVDYDRFNQVDWSVVRGRIKAMHDKWNLDSIVAESNSAGSPNIEALQREGLPVRSFDTNVSSKPPLVESLVLAFDRGEITALNDDLFKGELMAYERKVTPTGRSQYSAPAGMHDDCVMSLALAWYAVVNRAVITIGIFP